MLMFLLQTFMKGLNNEHNETFMEIQEVLEMQKRIIEYEMYMYKYPNGKRGIGARWIANFYSTFL